MTLKELQKILFEYEDKKYADFNAKLIPDIPRKKIIGIRSPKYKDILKRIKDDPVIPKFLDSVPHVYHEENCLHAQLINRMKDYDECVAALEKFIPYIDNWAVNDTVNPPCFKKHRDRLIKKIQKWIKSKKTYTRRCAMKLLMANYLGEDFKPEYLDLAADLRSGEYYVNMMTAWLFAEALAKQWDCAVKFIEEHRLDAWTHNKAIQKACESFRVLDKRKEYLKSLKIK
ncbi:MAG: DNA alkylation repair protein [Treponema sp.]|uniref:DNA alkylation repair protein n=1 Tax=Treponema sp. TaxID=166 RepID=UPI00298D920B|nr:DNA alkylation repair protein [Treponema sp.]MBR5932781.1 DNA alkylation repair protein [Treponema sp.]